ncbi:DNA-3-methyladenine glycosylase [Capsicum annuum]|uniref:DNA-3-methyladenine glycosylase n=1 Tax=Capsicum annuum TaxID=4072 RepID=UPI001FB18004|nr:DNA-3-methyladenine glycosylase [Capsicum annuum]
MSKQNVQKHYALEKHREKEKTRSKNSSTNFLLSKHWKKIYPIGLHKTGSSLSLSSLSLTLSQTSNDSSITDSSSITPLDQKISLALRLIASSREKKEVNSTTCNKNVARTVSPARSPSPSPSPSEEEFMRRCNWITSTSDKVYVQFHDECWGVPVYDDHQLFELLALCGMLMDFNWTEILKRRDQIREAFGGFNANHVAKMGESEIEELTSNTSLNLAENRVRCIVDNAKCIVKIVREFGSFSSYMWNYVNYKPIINRFRHPRNVPLRTPKAETISKDLLKKGFRFVGPVIVYSFMQAAGMTIDHLVDCFRHKDCVNLAERPWRHV